MAFYRSAGNVPHKRHVQHRNPEGGLYYEELMGEEGFSSDSSLLYHRYIPAAIREVLGDVPVTAPKGNFGNLGAGAGLVELAATLLGLQNGVVPPTRNYQTPDPKCPVNVVRDRPLKGAPATALVLNQSRMGHSVAVILSKA